MVFLAGLLYFQLSQLPLLLIKVIPDSMLESRTTCHENSTFLQLKTAPIMKNWGQPRPAGERIWHGKRGGHVLNATLTSFFILIWCSATILPLAKRAAYLSLHILQPADIRSGFTRFLLHHSVPPSQRLSLCRDALFSHGLSSLGD